VVSKTTLIDKIREIAILIRIQQLGTSVTAVIGALSVKGMSLDISSAFLLFLIGLIVNVGGQVHNDLCDLKIDKRSIDLKERPLVKGSVSIKTAKIIVFICLFLVFGLIFLFFFNIFALVVIIISFLFGLLYNLYSKKFPGADLFLSATMALFLLFGAIAVTNDFKGFQDIGVITWIIFVLCFVHVFLMDALGGGLKDVKNDRDSGAKTLAISVGVKANHNLLIPLGYKLIILLFDFSTIVFSLIPFLYLNFEYSIYQLVFIILLIILLVFSTYKLLNIKSFDRKMIKYHNRNHELAGYLIVPVVLLNIIGVLWVIFLVIFPILWFIYGLLISFLL